MNPRSGSPAESKVGRFSVRHPASTGPFADESVFLSEALGAARACDSDRVRLRMWPIGILFVLRWRDCVARIARDAGPSYSWNLGRREGGGRSPR